MRDSASGAVVFFAFVAIAVMLGITFWDIQGMVAGGTVSARAIP